MSAFIPVQTTTTTLAAAPPGTVPNIAGSPNQGAYIPVKAASAGVPGYQVEHRGVKGHHTVLHPIVYAQPPVVQQPPQPQVVVVQQPVPAPAPQVVSPPPAQQPINIKINNSQPEQQAAPMTINNSATSPQPQQTQPVLQQQAHPPAQQQAYTQQTPVITQ